MNLRIITLQPLCHLGRGLHPLVLGTAAFLSLLGTALPSYALAASMGGRSIIHHRALLLLSSSSMNNNSRSSSVLLFPSNIAQQHHTANSNTSFSRLSFRLQPLQPQLHHYSLFRRPTLFATTIRGGGGGGGQSSDDDDDEDTNSPNNNNNNNNMNPNMSMPSPTTVTTKSLLHRPIRKVTVVGGTHGNEYTGIWIIKSLNKQREKYLYNHQGLLQQQQQQQEHDRRRSPLLLTEEEEEGSSIIDKEKYADFQSDEKKTTTKATVYEQFSTLEINTLLANPRAYMENKRFIDVDLNREFSIEKLRSNVIVVSDTSSSNLNVDSTRSNSSSSSSSSSSTDTTDQGLKVLSSLPYESVRAREIEKLLGPKEEVFLATKKTDLSRTQFSSSFENEAQEENVVSSLNTTIMYHDHEQQQQQQLITDPNACIVIDLHTTTSNMGITLIIPEGDALMSAAAAYVLHKCQEKYGVENAQCVMHALPQRQDRMNLSSCGRHGFTIEVGPTPQGVLRHDVVEKTETALYALLEFLHRRNLELNDPVVEEEDYDDEKEKEKKKECYHSSHSSSSVFRELQQLYPHGVVPCYRSAPAIRPGELSGKIAWPNDDENPNFPKWMVHQSVQDRDFEPLRIGDPLFVDLDGTVIPYDGSHGEEVYLIFVNEGGYYFASSGTGIGVAIQSHFDLHTGWFVVESDKEEGAVEEVVVTVKDSFE